MVDPTERRPVGIVASASIATVDDEMRRLPPDSLSPDVADKLERGEYQPGDTIPMSVNGTTILVTYGGVVNCC